ncbi:hypothetical protein [Pseudophaeobacter sp.]|uniref:hypothetical protein n=1 Tax=Pseudophaeobacter sp. TaxID=1971739 RepID=UPI004059A9DF
MIYFGSSDFPNDPGATFFRAVQTEKQQIPPIERNCLWTACRDLLKFLRGLGQVIANTKQAPLLLAAGLCLWSQQQQLAR